MCYFLAELLTRFVKPIEISTGVIKSFSCEVVVKVSLSYPLDRNLLKALLWFVCTAKVTIVDIFNCQIFFILIAFLKYQFGDSCNNFPCVHSQSFRPQCIIFEMINNDFFHDHWILVVFAH
jgi:hypothetical protein